MKRTRKAAYCSVCKGYVWLGPSGGCVYGHDRYFLRDVHETDVLPNPVGVPPVAPLPPEGAPPPAPPGTPSAISSTQPPAADRPLPSYSKADGLPPGVGRFNWGAFLLPVFWPLAYNVPVYALVALAAHAAAYFAPPSMPAIAVPLQLASLGVDIWVGFAAHRAFWKKYPDKMSVEAYRKKQVKWVIIGVGLILLVFAFGVIAAMLHLDIAAPPV